MLNDRRSFITLLAGAVCAPRGNLFARPQPLPRVHPFRIDVHNHPIPPAWLGAKVVAASMPPEVVDKARRWSPRAEIEEMDRNGVATAVLSVVNPGVWFGDNAQSRRLVRAFNEYAVQLRADYPGRFGLFAPVVPPDVDGSLTELAYALDVLKADGIGVFTSYGNRWLADPSFAPVFEELNRRKAVVFVHPTAPSCCRKLIPTIPAALLEYPIDTTRCIVDWILTKSAFRYPDVRLIFCHAGGLITAGVGRLQILSETQEEMRTLLPRNFPAELSRFYYDISSSADPITMAALRAYVPASHILLGTDSPFIGSMTPNIEQLLRLGLPKAELSAIERNNALALLPRLS